MTAELPPDSATLRRFLLGDLPPAELEAVGRFLEDHPQVASTLAGLKADDTLLSALRGSAEASDPPDVAAAVARATGLVGGEPTTESLAPAPVGDATADPDTPDEGDDDPFAALAPAEADGELGRLGGYRVLRLLGKGGMGAVFEAADDRLGRRVALKVMLPTLAAKASARQRFLREAKAAAAVEHDFIVPIYQTGEDRGVSFLAMPLLAGETLDDRLHGGRPLAVADVLRIGREVAEGLAAAHAAGLVHRDIKPSNIWLERTADGAFKRTRILDFGLARTVTGADGLTDSGAILGTPAYMAPEQARGAALDHRADLFSLGCVLYHAATGRRPFAGAETFSVLLALATTEPAPATEVNPAVPAGLSNLITRLLAKDPAGRPASARAVADELARLALEPVRDSITHVAATGPVFPPAAGRPGGDTTEAFEPAALRRASRRRWRVAAAVLFVAVAGLAAANGPTIVRVVTNEGELVVEVDDPATEVVVKGGAVELRREEGGKKRVYLVTATKDGEVEVREPGSKDALVMEKFQLRRGGDVLVKVTADKLAAARQPKAGSPAPGPLAADQRKALEWVLSVGGFFSVNINDKLQTVRPGDAIPDGPLALHIIWLGDCKGVDDTSMENLRSVSALKDVSAGIMLNGTSITDIGLAKLAGYPGFSKIWELRLAETGVTNAAMAQLRRFPHLDNLSLSGTRITDAGLEQLRGLKLTTLNMQGCRGITGAGFAHLRDMTTLKGLGIGGCPVVGANLAHLKGLKLEGLTAGYQHGDGTAVGDTGLEHLTEMTSLTQLDLPHTGITDDGLARLQKLTKLGGLDLHGNPGVTGASGDGFVHMTSLKHLYLNSTGTSDAGLAKLTTLKNLEVLRLGSCKISDAGLGHLTALPKLRDLHLGQNAGVTDAGLKHFRDYPALADLWLGETAVTDAGLEYLPGVKTLRTVDFRLTKVTEAGVRKLAAARPDLLIHWDGPTIEPKASPPAPATDFREVHGAELNEIEAWAKALPAGYRPVMVSARAGGASPTFDAVARPDPTGKPWRLAYFTDLTDVEGGKRWLEKNTANGYASVLVTRYRAGALSGTLEVFHQDQPWGGYWGPRDVVRRHLDQAKVRSWSVESAGAIQIGADLVFYAAWIASADNPRFEYHDDVSADELADRVRECRAKGWRPRLVTAHQGRLPLRYAAVFEENVSGDEWEFQTGLTTGEYESELAPRRAAGFALRCVFSVEADGQVRYAAVWVRPRKESR